MIGSEEIRAMFPALEACPDVLLDNAGGSQVPGSVANAIRDYMLTTYTQLGGDYETSRRSTETVRRAHDFIKLFMNGVGQGEVMLGSSTTAQCIMLADCYRRAQREGRDEIVIAETAHEANAGPWARSSRNAAAAKARRYDELKRRLMGILRMQESERVNAGICWKEHKALDKVLATAGRVVSISGRLKPPKTPRLRRLRQQYRPVSTP